MNGDAEPATLVTQTRIKPGAEGRFAAWQQAMTAAVVSAPGYLDQEVIAPDPPLQQDWVIVQRFTSSDAIVDARCRAARTNGTSKYITSSIGYRAA